jgi:hypothetical protein
MFVTNDCFLFGRDRRGFARRQMPLQNIWRGNFGAGFRGGFECVYVSCNAVNIAQWFFETLQYLALAPTELLDGSVIAFSGKEKWQIETLHLMRGVRRFLSLRKGDFVFGRTVLSWEPMRCWSQALALVALRRHLASRVPGIDRKPPQIYAFLQRPIGRTRHISNLGALLSIANETYSGLRWEMREGYPTVCEGALWFNSARLMLAVHGSGCVPILFMQPRMVFCEVTTDGRWATLVNISRAVALWHVLYQPRILPKHYGRPVTWDLDPIGAQLVLEEGFRCLGEGEKIRPWRTASRSSTPAPSPSPVATQTLPQKWDGFDVIWE